MILHVLKNPRYFEWPASPSRSVIVAGVGRSGTTWLGDVVSHMIHGRVVFEPCITGKDSNLLIERSGKINLQEKYELPLPLWESVAFEKQKALIEHMLFGRIKGDWVDQDVKPGIYFRRVIKMIRANLFIGNIAQSWPDIRILYIVRSPHKVVESMLNQERYGWKFDWDSNDIFRCSDTSAEWSDLISKFDWNKNELIDRLALRWCVEMTMALQQMRDADNCMVLQYESLVREQGWNELVAFLQDRGCKGAPANQIKQKSSKTGSEDAAGKITLAPGQIERIRRMAQAYELDRWIV